MSVKIATMALSLLLIPQVIQAGIKAGPGSKDMSESFQRETILIAQVQGSGEASTRTMGVCFPAPNDNYSIENVISPKSQAAYYLRSYEQIETPYNPPGILTIESPRENRRYFRVSHALWMTLPIVDITGNILANLIQIP